MKRNVDLTQDNTFSRRNLFDISKYLKKRLGENYPWSFGNILHSLEVPCRLFFTGNKSERYYKRTSITGECCDKCGVSLSRKPWNSHWDLCLNCYHEVEDYIYYKEKPWNRK